jgi:hypothetical protein
LAGRGEQVGASGEPAGRHVRREREKIEPAAGPAREAPEQLVRLGEGGRVGERSGEVVGRLMRLVARQSGSCLLKGSVGGTANIHEREQ